MEARNTLLLVDDNPTTLEVLKGLLSSSDYRLLFAENGVEALKKASEYMPDLILLDVMLPEIDGYEVCRRIRADARLAEVPIMMITALDDRDSRLLGIEVGADDFISKPFDSDELKARVKAIIRLNRYRRLLNERIKFESLFHLSPDGILLTDQSGCIHLANPAMSEKLKLDNVMELTGKNLKTFVSDEYVDQFSDSLERMIHDNEKSSQFFSALIDTGGNKIPVEFNGQPIVWENQSDLLLIIRDFTEQEHLLDRIRKGIEDWQSTFDAVQDMMILTDLDGILIRCNRVTLEYFQSDFLDLIGMDIRKVFFGKADVSLDMTRLKGEIQFPRLKGWFAISSYPVPDSGNAQKYIYSIKDKTLSKEIEEKVAASQRLTDLGILAAGVTHDIKSPLQVITGRVESLLSQISSDYPVEKENLVYNLENIKRNAWRIETVMNSLLNYAHHSEDQLSFYNINELVKESLILIEHQLNTWANITVETDLSPNTPMVKCEQNKLSQVLVNLLMNARDAMPSGGSIIIRTRGDEHTQQVILQVVDTGSGIPFEIQDKIFDPFFTTKPIGQGTGLGLSNVKKIVKSCGGNIEVNSVPGSGTSFTILFPTGEPGD